MQCWEISAANLCAQLAGRSWDAVTYQGRRLGLRFRRKAVYYRVVSDTRETIDEEGPSRRVSLQSPECACGKIRSMHRDTPFGEELGDPGLATLSESLPRGWQRDPQEANALLKRVHASRECDQVYAPCRTFGPLLLARRAETESDRLPGSQYPIPGSASDDRLSALLGVNAIP
jgi:hypothetical protein